jgi:hypothetical protein
MRQVAKASKTTRQPLEHLTGFLMRKTTASNSSMLANDSKEVVIKSEIESGDRLTIGRTFELEFSLVI